jgi:glucokinase
LDDSHIAPLNKVQVREEGNKVLLAPGTGLGVSLVISREGGPVVVPSEGGHADFAPSDKEELDLWLFLNSRFGHVSFERVLSGPGLLHIYQWLRDSGGRKEAPWLARRLEQDPDPPAVISTAALEDQDPLSRAALDRFVSMLGAAAGSLALVAMATGGVYLAGGIPPKILPALQYGGFLESFVKKGRFRPLLERIGVRVILNQQAGLLGAARAASGLSGQPPEEGPQLPDS